MRLTRRNILAALPLRAGFGSCSEASAAQSTGSANARAARPRVEPNSIQRVVVDKRKHRMTLLCNDSPVRHYRIALGRNPHGHKRHEGDGRTPEGLYQLDWRNPESRFYKSIHISYPAPEDIAAAALLGVSPGGAIMIHGLPRRLAHLGTIHTEWDWTEGCIAVANEEMDEIWRLVADGTPIIIRP